MRVFENLDEFVAAAGTELGPSDWVLVDQKRIDTFADATGDHQWIHVDRVVVAEVLPSSPEEVVSLGVDGVLRLRPVQREPGDAVRLALEEDRLVGHAVKLW